MSDTLELYQKGNENLQREMFEEAKAAYSAALGRIDGSMDCEFLIKLLLNRGFCSWKSRDYDAAVEDFTAVLERLDILHSAQSLQLTMSWSLKSPNSIQLCRNYWIKALYRRAICLDYMGQFEAAFADLTQLLEHDPTIIVKDRICADLLSRLRQHLDEDHRAASSEGRPGWMSSQYQALRLNFSRTVPNTVSVNEPFTIKVALGNELGLFDRRLFRRVEEGMADEPLGQLHCEVIYLGDDEATLKRNLQLYQFCGNGADPMELVKALGDDGKAVMHFAFIERTKSSNDDTAIAESEASVNIMLRFSVRSFPFGDDSRDLEIMPLLTLPIILSSSRSLPSPSSSSLPLQDLVEAIKAVQVNCICPIQFQYLDRSFEVLCCQSVGLLGIGGKIWDSNFVLMRYLQSAASEFISNKRVLELGCGTGIAGLSLAPMLPAAVVLSDLPEVVALTTVNIRLNRSIGQLKEWIQDEQFQAISYCWGEALPIECDTIIASDVIYYPEGYAPLLKTLQQLLLVAGDEKRSSPVCIIAHRHRHPEDGQFFAALEQVKEIAVEEIAWKMLLKLQESPVCSDVRILRLTRNIG